MHSSSSHNLSRTCTPGLLTPIWHHISQWNSQVPWQRWGRQRPCHVLIPVCTPRPLPGRSSSPGWPFSISTAGVSHQQNRAWSISSMVICPCCMGSAVKASCAPTEEPENVKQTSETDHLWFSYHAFLQWAMYKYSFQLRALGVLAGNTALYMSKRRSTPLPWGTTGW